MALWVFLPILLASFSISCSPKPPGPGLPSALEIGVKNAHLSRHPQFMRVQTHFHGPYSYDACDDSGLDAEGKITEWCLRDYRYGLCYNRVDVAFSTDHLSNIGNHPYSSLIMTQPGDTPIQNQKGEIVANQIACPNGHPSIHAPGFEGPLLALGMERHVSKDRDELYGILGKGEKEAKELIERRTGAVVGVPHTESRSIEYLKSLEPSFIEIYNVHAQLHPRMRKEYLGLSPYSPLFPFVKYIVDPFRYFNADYLFMEFVEFSEVYFEKWNALLASGMKVTGTGGLDSHENVLKFKGSDDERLDAHRRMTRFMSNLVVVKERSLNGVKQAVRDGQVYVAIEGLGTPVGLDFYGTQIKRGTQSRQVIEMGETLNAGNGFSALEFQVPHVHPEFEGMDSDDASQPEVVAELHHVDTEGHETMIMEGAGPALRLENPEVGHYRVHVKIRPLHLKNYAAWESLASAWYPWIISNPIRVIKK